MATFSRILLSGTPASGRCIPIAATATPGTPIHTAVAGANAFDELFLWVTNVTNAAVALTIEWGGVGVANHLTDAYVIPANSPPIPIVTGQSINGGLIVAAYAGTTNALNISGVVNRIQ